MVHIMKKQWLIVLAVVLALAAWGANSSGMFSSQTVVITAVRYEGALYIMEDGEITSVVALSPEGQLVPEWDGTGFVFREMTDDELEARQALIEDVFSILLEDGEFGEVMGESDVELLGMFFSPPSQFLDERDKYSPLEDHMQDRPPPEMLDRTGPPGNLVSVLRDLLPDFVFYREPGMGIRDLYVLLSVDGVKYECEIDLASGTLKSYKLI